MRTYSPILAEQLMRSGGESRPYLAQRADQRVVPWPGDPTPAFAATYLIGDQLDAPPPSGQAVSLFFLARFRAQGGYVPVWSEFHRYEGGSGKQVLTYLDDTGETRQLDWNEDAVCRSELLLEVDATP